MYQALPYKTKQFFFVLIKLSIVIGAFYFIYNKIVSNPDLEFSEFLSFLNKNKVFSLKNAIFLIILSSFNWFFEILKWQSLVKVIQNITFLAAYKQSLGALTASLFTPNRIGDYGAKALYYAPRIRKKIVLLNFVGNLMQMIVTIFFGSVGLYYFIPKYNIEIPSQSASSLLILITVIGLIFVFGFKQRKFKIKGVSVKKVIDFIKNISSSKKTRVFLYSLIRYLIFSFQFYLLLHMFQVEMNYTESMILITSMYFIASVIPSIFVFDILIKGSVAVFVFSQIGLNEFTILSIVLLMWVLNFMIPSLIGSYYVMTFKMPKKVIA